jgi:ATP-binding cassette, subfamily B, bacterial
LSKARDHYIKLLKKYLLPHRRLLSALTFLLFANIGLQLINPQIMRSFIDTAKGGAPLDDIVTIGMLFLGIALVNEMMGIGARYVSEKLAWTSTNTLREDLALHCLRLDMSFHNKKTPGEMIERVDGDVASLANFFSDFTIRVIGNLILLSGVLCALYFENVRIGAAMTVYALVTVGSLLLMRNIAVPHWKEAREASANLFGFLEEHLSGTEDIRANGATGHTMNLLYGFAGERLRKELSASYVSVRLYCLTTILYVSGHILALVLGYYLYNLGTITVGTVFMIFWYTDMLFRPLSQLTRQMEDFQKAAASITRIEELTETTSKIVATRNETLPDGPLGVRFRDVTFGYDPEEPVLHDVGFELAPGKTLGLLGRTGSGKSTMSRLLFRLYDVTDGEIDLGGKDLRSLGISEVRHRVGMVTQSVQLFRGTVRDNLTFFDASVPDDHILGVIEKMGLMPWFDTLPSGLDTELENEGGGLSAGEAQLLTFTRVFLKDPGLVILDEASSRLDPATEAQIENAVEHLLENRTGIIIAHRLATVQRADDILILDDGRIVEHGLRSDLVADPESRLSALLKTGMTEVLS